LAHVFGQFALIILTVELQTRTALILVHSYGNSCGSLFTLALDCLKSQCWMV